MGRRPVLAAITFLSTLIALIAPLTAPAQAAAAEPPPQTAQPPGDAPVIVVSRDPGPLERLAAQELRRYLYRLTGTLPGVRTDAGPGDAPVIAIGRAPTNPLLSGLATGGDLPQPPGPEGYVIKNVGLDGRKAVAVLGADDNGVLYGAYRLLEQYGARFYLSRDVLPAGRTPFTIKDLDLREKPSVAHRGLLPWHDFLNGPSAYSLEDFERYVDQMAKMRMNTLVLHNYTGGYPGANINEPFLRLSCKGRSHDAWLDTSVDNQRWNLAASKAGDLAFHSGDYLPYDVLGSDAARFTKSQPDEQENVYRKAKAMMQQVIAYAQARGVEVVLGTDFDVVPNAITQAGCDALDPEVLKARIDDILDTYPTLKYVQMYFGEVSSAPTEEGIAAYKLMRDYLAEKRPWAKLITGSWFREDRFPAMDEQIQKDVIFSTLLPHDMTVRPEWSQLPGRERWPVPWMEFDGGLSEPQLAVERMQEQLPKLRASGVEGMIGILWRERAAEPNVAYLAQDAWQPPGEVLPAADFYRDFARANFGAAAAEQGAQAFSALERAGVYGFANGGPTTPEYGKFSLCGCARAAQEVARYRPVAERFRALEPLVEDPSGRDNLDFWVQFLRWLDGYWTANEKVPAATAKANPPPDNYFPIDSGGAGEKDLVADTLYHTSGYNAFTTPGTVTNDFGYPQAIRSEQWSSARFGYTFQIPEGYDRYRIELYFQEGFFGVLDPGDPTGRRVFDIEIDGNLVRDNFDIAAVAGGSLKGTKLSYDVPVPTDRKLDVEFVPVVSNPKVDIVKAFPIDAEGNPLPPKGPEPDPAGAWEALKASGFRDAIDASQRMVRDVPLLGGLVSAAGGRWYQGCQSCGGVSSYDAYERRVVDKLEVAPPTDLVARGTPTGATLSWRPYPGRESEVAGYHVWRAPAGGGDFERLTTTPVTKTSYADASDGAFRYAVTAVAEGGGQSPRSYAERVEAGRGDHTPPRVILLPRVDQAVTGEAFPVSATVVDGRAPEHVSATLRFRAIGSGNWFSLPMSRNVAGEPYTFHAAIPALAVTGSGVEYYVTATDGANTATGPAAGRDDPRSLTPVAPQGPRPGTPREVTVTAEADGANLVSWRPADGPVHLYRLYRGTTPGFVPGPSTYLTYVSAAQLEFRDITASAGTRYVYKVVAVTASDRSGPPSPPAR